MVRYSIDWLLKQLEEGESPKYLFFWGHTPEHNQKVGSYCLSQWFEASFIINDITYPTAEHWMMAEKARLFDDKEILEQIIAAKTPGEAKDLGRKVRNFDAMEWERKRFDIVVQGNIHKFNQHPDYLEYLLNTKKRILVEASPVDAIWGVGMAKDHPDVLNPFAWKGDNLLGFALMEARNLLKKSN